MAKSASLTAELVAKKGEASPATDVEQSPASTGKNYYKSLTVKLDRERYEKLKNMGVRLDKRSQEIFVEALDLWLESAASQQKH